MGADQMATTVTPVDTSTEGEAPPTPVQTDTEEGNEVVNSSSLALILDNSAGEDPAEVTFVTVAEVAGYSVENVTATIPAGSSRVFGRFPANVFGPRIQFSTDIAVDVVAYA